MLSISAKLGEMMVALEDAIHYGDWDIVEEVVRDIDILKEDLESEFHMPGADLDFDDD
jgi:hypothetical protein